MPTINVARDALFQQLEHTYTDEEFDRLCFEFGIELDDVTSEAAMLRKEKGENAEVAADDEIIYKIEIPANRYDLLCIEGLSMALRQFLGKMEPPVFTVTAPVHHMVVQPETNAIRPFVVCAVLRNITFNRERYNSFIDLQDKLHTNICRKRTLVAIGTHDLDTLEGPFTYRALPPRDINFVPLNQSKSMNAEQLMTFYESDSKLKKFLDIIRSAPRYPVIYDAQDRVLSLPPIINSDHSKISYGTRNVFIECTATDLTKAKVVLNTMCTMFAMYLDTPFQIEAVQVDNPNMSPPSQLFPQLTPHMIEVSVEYIRKIGGVPVHGPDMVNLLKRMSVPAVFNPDTGLIVASPPATRSDILQACDIAEDCAIAYGFNNIPLSLPSTSTIGHQQPINRLTDSLRLEVAMAGFSEILTFALCSHDEAFKMLNRPDNHTAVVLGNPKTIEFEIVRPSLIPGLLKSMFHNKAAPLPLRLFEISDITLLDAQSDVGASNQRRFAAVYAGATAGFEILHGLLDRVMQVMGVDISDDDGTKPDGEYVVVEGEDPAFFPGRCVNVIFRKKQIGVFGVLHPTVLHSYDIPHAMSALEINIEAFL